ncbi:MAG: Phosphoglycolate phosphatase [candidate division TA06 bacterium ADurb.Bin417]|uniref:Phosphoglycolate phosphatase n=1 Tax=candidate division TA06 bacterium ADurb.Bin417 TaxID=1852828 RepID=A0A1V5M5U9_UNCT6|nr:MAG: Phosphoglycolate phosphatase [candidate division TA06 bacterium ADurb.Bin417]
MPESHFREAQRIYREDHLPRLSSDSRLLPGALELLERLKAHGKKLAVATNRSRESADILLDTLAIRPYFDRVLVGDEVPNPKPAPDILLALLEHFGVAPAETLYVGDMTIDAQTGAAAGVDTLIVITGSSSRAEVAAAAPYRIIDSLADFPAGEYRD